MKKSCFVLAILFISVAVYPQKTINDPNAEMRQVSTFNKISVSNSFDVYITQSSQEGLAISASKPEYRDRIKTKVENGVLIIRWENDKKFWKGFSGDKIKLKVYISVKELERLSVSGACDVFMEEGIKSDKLGINLSGASDLKGKVDVKNLVVNLSGASDMDIIGKAETVDVDVSGASDFKSFELTTDICSAEASGASSVSITVNKELNIHASGASSIKFKGGGMIKSIRTSGASSVSRKS